MPSYFRRLPEKDLGHRQRFVIVATFLSFIGILLLWILIGLVVRRIRGTPETVNRSRESVEAIATPSPQRLEDILRPSSRSPVTRSSPSSFPVSSELPLLLPEVSPAVTTVPSPVGPASPPTL